MATDWKYHYFSILTQMVLFFSFWYLTLFATDAGVLTINIRDDFEAFKRDISKDTKGLNLCAGCLVCSIPFLHLIAYKFLCTPFSILIILDSKAHPIETC